MSAIAPVGQSLEPKPDFFLTLPAGYYTDPSIFVLEKERIFANCWQFAGHVEQLPQVGSFFTLELLDESLFFIRTSANEIKGFYNVCRHRAHQLLDGEGSTDAIVCPYHAWRYGLDGRLQHARNSENVGGFDKEKLSLVPVKVDLFFGIIMFNLNPQASSFESQTPGFADEVRVACPRVDELILKPAAASGFTASELECNWKVLVDNCVECYHCKPAHSAFVDLIEMESYGITLHERHSSHVATSRPESKAYSYIPNEQARGFGFWHVWPNMTFGTFPGTPNLAAFCSHPVSLTRSKARGLRLRLPTPPTAEEIERTRYVDQILWPEDKAVCESVQCGLGSRSYNQGTLMAQRPYTGDSEAVVHLFQRLTLEALGERSK